MKKLKSKDIYDKVVKGSTEKGRRSMENLKNVCDEMTENGLQLTVAAVGRELARRKLSPRSQTIRNNKGLRDYIILRSKDQVIERPSLDGKGEPWVLDLLEQYKRENRLLRELIKTIKL